MNKVDIFSHLNYQIEVYDTVTSTQDVCLERAEGSENKVIVGINQSQGRGTRNRNWNSSVGGLWFSFSQIHSNPEELPTIISVALHKTLSKYAPEVSIKWFNDIYLKDKKLAGILCETHHTKQNITICGVGININNSVADSQNSIALKEILGKEIDITTILKLFLQNLKETLELSFYDIKTYFKQDNYSIGKILTINKKMYTIISILDDLSLELQDEDDIISTLSWEEYYQKSLN
jgi:BirA family biotin operon repressor/biotin-[acetyl-CoA-carboxylase] ligase